MEAVAEKNPKSAAVQTSAARAYLQAGDIPKALAHADQALPLAPQDPFPLTTRGLAHYAAKDFPKAAEDAQKALQAAPGDPVAHALYMLSKGRPAGGSDMKVPEPKRPGQEPASLPQSPYAPAAAGARDDDPELAPYKTEEGRSYARALGAAERALKRRDFMSAFGIASSALKMDEGSPRASAARALAAWNLRDYGRAAEDASRVLAVKPDLTIMLIVRAAAYNDLGRRAEALKDAERALAVDSRSARAYQERALAREGLGQPKAGVLGDFKRAAELDPSLERDFEDALDRLARGEGRAIRKGAPAAPQAPAAGGWILAALLLVAASYAAGRLLAARRG
ncbi:MAG TPA: tetratricopeptide repeat protein [Elusimicrobiota bacterium]|nr:tetratricopeptide repeat protein [Elusimicrobiota bacterium]